MAALDSTAQPGAGWDEAQCTAALAQLEQLQAQIDDLRLAIPRIIEPFQRPPNPSTFKLYSQGVIGSQNGIKSLSEQWKSPEIQGMYDHVRESLAANADLAASASLPSHGWVERERREREAKKGQAKRIEAVEEVGAVLTDEEISQIVVEFRKAHPNIRMDTQDDNRSILVQFVSASTKYRFRITIECDGNGRHKLNAACLGTTEPFLAITRCIASRPNTNDLKHLLNMIASYKSIKGTPCVKCKKLLDSAALTTTARRCMQVGTNETLKVEWAALHESCLG
ncbi:hypothetical protein P153DRAFT_381711 [Dothidotthia symphoricarpi CBS 119687]|uniref:Uncharacterized protein n=1 Tax=Dothidotthia symphoricarpi CBS 119687 TaxID=1392245 RepID=A0A6A6APZ5_9PLEO|nr:uncharacterized protein P153DRAFT_381711 [Dothidotthia symphoricarpi CBS 119687]KAF2133273.1 hypothetical protein P153DRAFT_381711 [Dothidotthia symphoricarpi CBS 119687]